MTELVSSVAGVREMSLPPLPNSHALAGLALTVLVLTLSTRESIRLESSCFLALIGLAVMFGI
jgi:hypothetical protein